jgi:hypothetical protein
MRLHADHNEAWRSNPDTTSAFIVRLAAKNSLPLTLPAIVRTSPLAKMHRIIAQQDPQGFDLHRSGGNPTVKGNAPPGPSGRSAGEGAFLSTNSLFKMPTT